MSARDLYALELYANGHSLLRARRLAGLRCGWSHRHDALLDLVGSALTRRHAGLPMAPAVFLAVYGAMLGALALLGR